MRLIFNYKTWVPSGLNQDFVSFLMDSIDSYASQLSLALALCSRAWDSNVSNFCVLLRFLHTSATNAFSLLVKAALPTIFTAFNFTAVSYRFSCHYHQRRLDFRRSQLSSPVFDPP